MDFTDIIEQVDFLQYLSREGYKKDEIKSSSSQLVLQNSSGERLLLLKHRRTGDLIYKNLHDDQDKGNVVNFVVNRLDGFINTTRKSSEDYAKAANALKEYLNIPKEDLKLSSLPKISNKPKVPFEYNNYEPKQINDITYLESRGILKETLQNEKFSTQIINCRHLMEQLRKNLLKYSQVMFS